MNIPYKFFVFGLSIIFVTFHKAACLPVTAEASRTDLGDNATFKCNPTLGTGKRAFALSVQRGSSQLVTVTFSNGLNERSLTLDPSSINARYSYDITTFTLTVSSVTCDDNNDATFKCTFSGLAADGSVSSDETEASIYIKVPPKAPNDLSTTPVDLTSGLKNGSSLSVVCNANIGRLNKGKIRWRIYRGNSATDVPENDSRVTQTDVGPATGDPTCSKRYESILRLPSVSPTDQDLVLACFVKNDEFQPQLPASCTGPADYCQQTATIKILYEVTAIQATVSSSTVNEGDSVTFSCKASGYPTPTYQWFKGTEGNATSVNTTDTYYIAKANIEEDSGSYFCVAKNTINGQVSNETEIVSLTVVPRPTMQPTTEPPETSKPTSGTDPSPQPTKGDDDDATVIIVVVVLVVVVAIIVIVAVVYFLKCRRTKEAIEEPPEKPSYNNRQNMSNLAYQHSQPDLVTTDGKKPSTPSLNNSFDLNNEDGLRYADLTYDNRPRSRRPMAIGDTSSEYSDIQMPQV